MWVCIIQTCTMYIHTHWQIQCYMHTHTYMHTYVHTCAHTHAEHTHANIVSLLISIFASLAGFIPTGLKKNIHMTVFKFQHKLNLSQTLTTHAHACTHTHTHTHKHYTHTKHTQKHSCTRTQQTIASLFSFSLGVAELLISRTKSIIKVFYVLDWSCIWCDQTLIGVSGHLQFQHWSTRTDGFWQSTESILLATHYFATWT